MCVIAKTNIISLNRIDIILGGDCGHNRALYSPCPCHGKVAQFPPEYPIHQDEREARETLDRLTQLSRHDNVWVVLSHEVEVSDYVVDEMDLSDWYRAGHKVAVHEAMDKSRRRWCYADDAQ